MSEIEPHFIALLTFDPDLGRGLDPDELRQARRLVVGVRCELPVGRWEPRHGSHAVSESPFGALVVDGLVTFERSLDRTINAEIIGPGDMIQPWAAEPGLLPAETVWTVVEPTTLAVLDRRFLTAVRRWPVLAQRLVERMTEQNARLSVHATINGIRHVELRILAMLWHLAGLYGKVTPGGVLLPLRLSHAAIGRLIGARRPTVTLALRVLGEQGHVQIDGERRFLLADGSRALLAPQLDGAERLSGGAIAVTEPVHVARRPRTLGAVPDETRTVDRLRGEVAVLRSAEGELRALLDLTGAGVLRLEAASGRLLGLSPRAASILGGRMQELLHTSLWDLVDPDARAASRERLAPLISGRVARVEIEVPIRGPDGARRWGRTTFARLAALNGDRPQLIAVMRDVTAPRALDVARQPAPV